MCRSIKTLRRPEGRPTDEELQAAALQFVRKVSGYRAPSQANREVFEQAVADIAHSTRLLLDSLVTPPRPANPARTKPERQSESESAAGGLPSAV